MIEYTIHVGGLGGTISILSTLLDTKQPVHFTTNNTIAVDLKRIFNIADDKLIVTIDPDLPSDMAKDARLNDGSKFFSPYLTANTVNLFGQQFKVGRQDKPCIGLAPGYQTAIAYPNGFPSNDFPFCRYYPQDYWFRVEALIMQAGYEIITFNNHLTSIEDKTYLLNEYCDAVIAYEGGIAHLAHCLKIPAVVLPWNNNPLKPGTADRYHVDAKTWIPDCADQVLQMSPQDLRRRIQDLHSDKGNNPFLNQKLDPNNIFELNQFFSDFERDFIQTYIKPTQIG